MSKHFRPLFAALCGATVLVLAGCGEDTGPTGATCPTGGTQLSYENFGKTFMDQYCTRCHSTTLTGAARQSAPAGHDYNTASGIRADVKLIDSWAGAGPDRTNTEMPRNGTKPTDAERKQLSEWLACGAP
jgi:uncharacterized membrane protein